MMSHVPIPGMNYGGQDQGYGGPGPLQEGY